MNSHLTILINDREMVLPDDFTIDVEDQNPVFNSTEMFSYPFEIPLDGNRWLVKNIENSQSSLRAVSLEHLPTRINVDGVPFRSGTLVMSDDEEITDSLSMNIDAGTQSFDDLISNLNCRDVPVKDKIKIGEKIGNVKVRIESDPKVEVSIHMDGSKTKKDVNETVTIQAAHVSISKILEPQALGFSYPAKCVADTPGKEGYTDIAVKDGEKSYPGGHTVAVPLRYALGDYINVSAAYGEKDGAWRAATYCNARVCYKHHALDDDGTTSDSGIYMKDCTWANEDLYPYWVLDARRPQSGICFYVLYFLDCLFAHLKVEFDKSALLEIEDFKHLCFFTTVCAYDTQPSDRCGTFYSQEEIDAARDKINASGYVQGSDTEAEYTALQVAGTIKDGYFKSQEHINAWLNSRGCGGQLNVTTAEDKSVNELTLTKSDGTTEFIKVGDWNHYKLYEKFLDDTEYLCKVTGISVKGEIKTFSVQANVLEMLANSDNFPDETVSTVIESLESAFGIKFNYDYEKKKVTAYLIRSVLQNNEDNKARKFHGKIHSITPVTEKITGVRMRYSEESDASDQRQNIKDYNNGKNLDQDTDYDYTDYREPDSEGGNGVVYDQTYTDFFHNLSSGDKHCYIDRKTGNAYRIKVNGEATTTADLKPVLFEVGQFKGVEYGDCSEENEDYIHDISIDFQPVPFNDVNYFKEVEAAYGSSTGTNLATGDTYGVKIEEGQPILCAYVDEDMEHEFVEQIINQTISTALCDYYLQEKLTLLESYNPADTEDGNSPLQDDSRWGFALALMRGGGSDATRQQYDYNYDSFGNSRWRTVAGEYALATDSLDVMGNEFDYNGTAEGIGSGERFSLKIRAYKEPDWLSKEKYKDVVLCDPDVYDSDGNLVTKIRSRGLFDTFILPYAYFLLNRKKYKIRLSASAAQIADIPNHWQDWWDIGGIKCLIDTVSTTIDMKTGIDEVELTVYAL